MDWYYEHNGASHGPVSQSTLESMMHDGRIAASSLVWREGMDDWTPAHRVFGTPRRTSAVAHPPPHSGSPFQNALEWIPALIVFATPWLSMQFMVAVERKHDSPLLVAMIMLAITAAVFGIFYGAYFLIRHVAAGHASKPSKERVFRETVWVFALLESLVAFAFFAVTTGQRGYGGRQTAQIHAVNRAALFALVVLLTIGVVGWIRERTVYGRTHHR